MRTLAVAALALFAWTSVGHSDEYVRGYTTKNGTYVAPYYRSSPNGTTLDNYSTKGNTNPYTGQPGYKDPYVTPSYDPFKPRSGGDPWGN